MIKRIFAVCAMSVALTACGGAATEKAKAANSDATPQTTETTSEDMQEQTFPEGSKKVEVETSVGTFTVLLYGDTPKHRDNFLKLAREGYYNGTLFHRVINKFMVQAGDPASKNAKPGQMLGSGDPGYTIEAEIVYPKHFHKKGALAAARTGDQVNPERRSSGSQFYVVTGDVYNQAQLQQMDQRTRNSQMQNHFNTLVRQNQDEVNRLRAAADQAGLDALRDRLVEETEAWARTNAIGMTPEMKAAYTTVGGTPHLDNEYTVFGEVISGMDVIETIEKVETGAADRPVDDIKIISTKVLDD